MDIPMINQTPVLHWQSFKSKLVVNLGWPQPSLKRWDYSCIVPCSSFKLPSEQTSRASWKIIILLETSNPLYWQACQPRRFAIDVVKFTCMLLHVCIWVDILPHYGASILICLQLLVLLPWQHHPNNGIHSAGRLQRFASEGASWALATCLRMCLRNWVIKCINDNNGS